MADYLQTSNCSGAIKSKSYSKFKSIMIPITIALSFAVVVLVVMLMMKPATTATKENPELFVECSDASIGDIIKLRVKAVGGANSQCFTLTFNGSGAGLSEKYIFNDDKTTITDNKDNAILLNREIGGDGAVNYWFNLANGYQTEFTLDCESGVFVTTVYDEEDYLNMVTAQTPDEAKNQLQQIKQDDVLLKQSQLDTATLDVVGGCGADLNGAKYNTTINETLYLSWSKPQATEGVAMFRAVREEVVYSGKLTDTIDWAYTYNKYTNMYTLTISGTGDMPDFANQNESPWNSFRSKISKVVIEDGITSVGNSNFYNCSATSLYIGNTVTEIRGSAFYLMNQLTNVVVPGNVKSLSRYAFGYTQRLESIVFEEGVETIGAQVLDGCQKLKSVSFPSTVTSIASNYENGAPLEVVTISPDNPVYFIYDDVIYQRTSDTTVNLFKMLSNSTKEEFIIPATANGYQVNSVGAYAFSYGKNLKKLTIPNTVTQVISGDNIFLKSALEEIIFEEGVLIKSSRAMNECTKLKKVTIYDSAINDYSWFYFNTCSSLEEMYIPTGVNNIVDYSVSTATPNLNKVYFNAINCKWYQRQSAVARKYDLTIGEKVDLLRDNKDSTGINANGFQAVLLNAQTVKFAGENQITVENAVFSDMPKPLNSIVGTVWVDSQGVVYKYSSETLTASVIYVPFDATEITIPKEITPESGVTCVVNEVNEYAFKLAESLTTLTFEYPAVIERVASYGIAYCSKLSSVNGYKTIEEAQAIFTNENVSIGYRPFFYTALESKAGESVDYSSADGLKAITLLSESMEPLVVSVYDETGSIWTDEDEIGKYSILTGETIAINMVAGNSEAQSNDVYRIYFELSQLEGSVSMSPGDSITMNGTPMTCYATNAPNIIYVEITPSVGTTINTTVEVSYPSPDSAGGNLRVWGMSLTPQQAQENAGSIIECESVLNSDGTVNHIKGLQVEWHTKEDDFALTKTSTGNTTVSIAGDGKGGLMPGAAVSYSIRYARASTDTSAFGKDYVKTVDFYDYIDFGGESSGVGWNKQVLESVKNGNTRYSGGYFYADDVAIARISNSGSAIANAMIEYNEEKGIVLRWKIANSSVTAEIATTTTTLTIYAEAISLDASLLEDAAGTTYEYTNFAEAVTHYTYSADKKVTSSAVKYFSLVQGKISITNNAIVSAEYFGSDIDYVITVANTGAMPYRGVEGKEYTVVDEMSNYSYITAENMERMFADEYGKNLTITISNALICPHQAVTAENGSVSYITGANSNVDATAEKLVITYNSNKASLEILREDGTVITVDDTLQSALDSIGYSVGYSTDFDLKWLVTDEATPFVLKGGESLVYNVYANYKDTFMMLTGDYRNHHPTDTKLSIRNTAYLYQSGKSSYVVRAIKDTYMYREAFIYKSGYLNSTGERLSDDFSIRLDDVIDYTVEFEHFGTGEYHDLPMVDDIYGTQVLLVPVQQNPQLADKGLGTATALEDGKEVLFYKLSESGTYKNVTVGINEDGEYMIADTITVTAVGEETDITIDGIVRTYSGLQTTVKWYYDYLPDKAYYLQVNYHTLVDSEQLHSAVINTGNVVWMNDKTFDRIYDALWGGGSLLEPDKTIVTKNQDGTYTADADDYTTIGNGESTTYCLSLYNPNDYTYTINGTYFFDVLPFTGDVFKWEKNINVKVYYEESSSATVSNLDSWYIDDEAYGVYQQGIYYIKWNADTVAEIGPYSTLKIYVTLDFPKNTASADMWSQYYRAVGGGNVENSFVVYGKYNTVYHGLKEQANAVLQKGVYATYRYKGTSSLTFTQTARRVYYNNQDNTGRAITYYVVLYNQGYTRLYLNDIHDQLPQGFEYSRMLETTAVPSAVTNKITTKDSNQYSTLTTLIEEPVNYVSAGVTAIASDGAVTFEFSSGMGENAVKHDVEKDKYYLDHNEAVVFAYACSIGETAQTEDTAINAVGMEYDDYLDSGIRCTTAEEAVINGKITDLYDEQNDGTRTVSYGSDIKNIYSFAQNSADKSQWLVSEVAVNRGGIIPGVTNYTDSYVNANSTIVTPYKTSVSPFATINWRSRLHNSGTCSVTDYTFVNNLPNPYGLTGDVAIKIYDSHNANAVVSYNLFTVTDRTDEYITITANSGKNYKLLLDGTKQTIVIVENKNEPNITIDVSVTRNSNGEETLEIVFSDKIFSIPENEGYVDVTMSGINTTSFYENTVYTNFSYLMPNVQPYDSVAQGSIVYNESEIYGVVNTSPVNVSTGYSTSSVKKVEELNRDNYTTSNSDTRYILLEDKQSEFRYTLAVTNDTNFGMSKLILIDNLPQKGDHSPFNKDALRNSEFNVSLAETPDFTVTVYPEEGGSYQIPKEYYSVGYSTATEFTSSDWDGTSAWDTQAENIEDVRSIRLFVDDKHGLQIPAKASVEFSFNAIIDDQNATAGMIAWNDFGYHYGLVGISYELEAMPLAVGVKLPQAPILQKKLVDVKGNAHKAEKDTTFSYIIYKGTKLTEDFTTAIQLKEILAEKNIAFAQVDLTVKKGETESDAKKLVLDDWVWQESDYTIVEINNDKDYTLANWNNRVASSYTFKYNADVKVSLICTNACVKWGFEILKIDGINNSQTLSGAVFAIYSPNQSDMISDDAYDLTGFKPEKIYTDANEKQWYLCTVATTNGNGVCSFNELIRSEYYLLEVKSPDGYVLDFKPRLINSDTMNTQLVIKNYTMTTLPYTGGIGVYGIVFGKIILIPSLFAIVFIFVRKRYAKAE